MFHLKASVTFAVIVVLAPNSVLPQMTNGSEPNIPSWLTSTTIQTQIAIVFNRIDNIDIVLADRANDHLDQLDYLVRLLRGKSVRIHLEATNGDEIDRCTTVVSDQDYEDDMKFVRLDRTYGSFTKIWEHSEGDGYVVIGNISTFERLEGCLVGPAGTYLVLSEGSFEDQVTRDQVSRSMQAIWGRKGVYRLLILVDGRIYWYDPFAKKSDGYGVLKELSETENIPAIPRNDFKGYPLRIEMFWSTYTVPMDESVPEVNFLGPDAEVCRALTKAMNFTPQYIRPDGDNFGVQLPNGSFNGVIGRLSRRESDVAFVGFFVKDYFSRDIEFTTGVYDDEICCLVKKASRIPEYLLPITIFPSDLWGVLFLSGICFSIIWMVIRACIQIAVGSQSTDNYQRLVHLFNVSNGTRDAPKYQKVIRIFVDTYIIWVSAPFRRFTRSSVERLMLFGMMLVSLIFISMFQSSLASVFLNPVYYKDIDTLDQLDKSGLKIEVKYRGFMDDVFPANNSPTMDALRSKMVHMPIRGSMPARVAQLGTISTVTRKTTLSLDNSIFLSTNQLHMVRECPRTYNLAYVVSKHSVFMERINAVIGRLFDGGLLDHWISEINFNTTIRDWEQIRNSQDANFKILTIVDMQFPFYLLSIGICVSTVVFMIEHLYHWIGKTRSVKGKHSSR